MAKTTYCNAAIINSVLNFMKVGSLQPASTPGFSHALKLSHNTILKDNISAGPKTLTYRYRFGSRDVPEATLGIYCALMDELSTSALFAVGQPSAPGASLQFQTELLDENFQSVREVDVVNTVTKLGRTVSNSRTEFLCATSGKKLAFSSHVKYMPTGSQLLDWLFRYRQLWDLYVTAFVPSDKDFPVYEEKSLLGDVIRTNLEFHDGGRATFQITREHVNAFGAMHGGCQAIVMEEVGEAYALAELRCDTVILQAIQIDLLSAARKSFEVVCETIGTTEEGSTIYVRVMFKNEDSILSEGKLRFSKPACQ